ncbi:hypothetical protein FOA43_002845 [Brettanomyces nanus]|uniref:Uncharacterized protein n=1 Tax=Eeniella nana TaxID=13502 RepID=A0A875RPU7_EENNA|nr:uncharacterized protein FOA43_002845 [Brettanomyces nanus]QPG75490.1 hypothetical protein FOA43_002845 [Brettanomyces nanus]
MCAWARITPQLSRPLFLFNSRTYATTKTQAASSSSSSLLGSLTPNVSTEKDLLPPRKDAEEASNAAMENEVKYVKPEEDAKLQEYLNPKPYKTVNSLLSPLKRRLYLDNVTKNGFFKNGDLITLPDGISYRLKLSREEIEALEPSIYLRSWRIKSSVKKTNIVLRALKDLPLKKAITQLHFMPKKVARDLFEMLERGLQDAEKMNYDVNSIYVAESWVHTDGHWARRIECKGRGRTGIITHRWISVRFLLKTEQTKKRLAYEAERRSDKRIAKCVLTSEKIRGPCQGYYKW